VLLLAPVAGGVSGSQAVPAEWFQGCAGHVKEAELHDRILLIGAELRKDWPAALELAERCIARLPHQYSYYWHQARALHELGRDAQAIEPLTTFVRYCHDQREHREAAALLARLRERAAAPPQLDRTLSNP
jgi:hypothetical protein